MLIRIRYVPTFAVQYGTTAYSSRFVSYLATDSRWVATGHVQLAQNLRNEEQSGFKYLRKGEITDVVVSFFIIFFLEHDPSLFHHQAAKEVAKFLGTVHHSYEYTVQEGLDAISEVSFLRHKILYTYAAGIRCIIEGQEH